MYTKFFLVFISFILFLMFNIWTILKTKFGEWMTLSVFTKIDIVEERNSFSDDFVHHDYENYTKILLAAVVTTFVILIVLWSVNKRIRRKCIPPVLATSGTYNNVEVIWECSDEADENDRKFVDSQNDKDNNEEDLKTLVEIHKQLINQDTLLYGSLRERISIIEQSLSTVKDQVEKLNEEYRNLYQIQNASTVSDIPSSEIFSLKDHLEEELWQKTDKKLEMDNENVNCILSSQEIIVPIESTGDNKVMSDIVVSPIPNPVLSQDDNTAYKNIFNEEEYLRNSKLKFSNASYIQNKTKRANLPRKPGTICMLQDNSILQDQKSAVEVKEGKSCAENVQVKRPSHSRHSRRRF